MHKNSSKTNLKVWVFKLSCKSGPKKCAVPRFNYICSLTNSYFIQRYKTKIKNQALLGLQKSGKSSSVAHTPKISTSYLIACSPAMLVATHKYWPWSASAAFRISSFFPPELTRSLSLTSTGTPSFNQVRRGGGLPTALHSNVSELPATTCLFWALSASPSITGGTVEREKYIVSD